MKLARNLFAVVGVFTLLAWGFGAFVNDTSIRGGSFIFLIGRPGIGIGVAEGSRPPQGIHLLEPAGPFWIMPTISDRTFVKAVLIPHWLSNQMAWSAFYLLSCRIRRAAKRRCQNCGRPLNHAGDSCQPACEGAATPA
ncbi:MAG: hypothetical protein KDA33_03910 [Phycisphaerales bacterium]|nr:hypothetical protein [Phycisphaerales bacterium]